MKNYLILLFLLLFWSNSFGQEVIQKPVIFKSSITFGNVLRYDWPSGGGGSTGIAVYASWANWASNAVLANYASVANLASNVNSKVGSATNADLSLYASVANLASNVNSKVGSATNADLAAYASVANLASNVNSKVGSATNADYASVANYSSGVVVEVTNGIVSVVSNSFNSLLSMWGFNRDGDVTPFEATSITNTSLWIMSSDGIYHPGLGTSNEACWMLVGGVLTPRN